MKKYILGVALFALAAFWILSAGAPVPGSPQTNTFAAIGSNNPFTGNNTHSGAETFDDINNTIFWNGSAAYPFTAAGLQSAINAACSGGVPGKVVLPPMTVTGLNAQSAINSSNCTVEGSGKYVSTIKASASLTVTPLAVGAFSHIRFINFGVDGNRSDNGGANTHTFDCIDIGSGASDVLVEGVKASNCRGQGMGVFGTSSDVTIQYSETDHNGSGSIASPGTSGINVAALSGSISRIYIGPGNKIHDNNGGVIVTNSTSSANLVSDVTIFENVVYANGNDGVLVSANAPSGGAIMNLSAKGNRGFCNGDSTALFPAACTAGFYQTHVTISPGGVCIDLITNGDQLLVQPLIENNSCHDNIFEGIATTSNIKACVTVTTATTVTQVAAANCSLAANQPFKTTWKAGQSIGIASLDYAITSCSSKTVCTLAAPGDAGNPANTPATLSTYMWASVIGNVQFHDGNVSGAFVVGPGIYCSHADGNTYSGNTMRNNNLEGLELSGCSFSSSTGDRAFSNDINSTASRNYGFASYGGLGNQFINDVADDPVASPTQTVGVFINSASTNTMVKSMALYGSVAPIQNNGSNSMLDIPVALSSLGAASAANAGQWRAIGDSTIVSVEGQTCVGSSGNYAMAFSTGTLWKCF